MTQQFDGKVVVITGGDAGLGRECALWGPCARWRWAAIDEDGRLDIVFANAKGVFLSGKHACKQMKTQGGGNIVVTVSAGGLNAYPGFGPYNAGKSGTIGLINSMAYDCGRYGIRVNGLAPTHGMSVNFAMPPDADVLGLSYEQASLAGSGAEWDPVAMVPGPLKVQRPPALRDNAAVATFLASDGSEYISGVVIPSCDGGSFARTSIPIPELWSLDEQVALMQLKHSFTLPAAAF